MSRYYGIKKGRTTGIFDDYDHVQPHVDRFSGAKHKGFESYEEAHWYVHGTPWLCIGPFAEVHAEDGRVTRLPLTDPLHEFLRDNGFLS
jgi:viroplasmin and RNaseH domain-containing protein